LIQGRRNGGLRHAYGIDSDEIITGFQKLLGLPNVAIEDSWTIFQALNWHKEGLDFADALHMASSLKASRFATADICPPSPGLSTLNCEP